MDNRKLLHKIDFEPVSYTHLHFFGLPVTLISYGSSVIPSILSVWLMSYVEPLADKISPKPIKFLSKPLITILIVAPVTFIVPVSYTHLDVYKRQAPGPSTR